MMDFPNSICEGGFELVIARKYSENNSNEFKANIYTLFRIRHNQFKKSIFLKTQYPQPKPVIILHMQTDELNVPSKLITIF